MTSQKGQEITQNEWKAAVIKKGIELGSSKMKQLHPFCESDPLLNTS